MNKARVIIVEDEWIIADDLEKRLVGMGYRVDAKAASGLKALDLIDHHKPDLVLMDIRLRGGMDGIEAAHIVRKQYQIPIVFLTAFSSTQLIERAKLAEPMGYLLKPVRSRELNTAIEIALHKSQVASRTSRSREKLEDRIDETTKDLEKVNSALKAMMDNREIEKRAIEQNIFLNIKKHVFPYLDELEVRLTNINANLVKVIRTNLEQSVLTGSNTLFARYLDLTPTEIKVADFIRVGKSTKEIASLMNIAPSTVSSYRNLIRKKMGLLNSHTNLRVYLNSLYK